MTVLGQHFIGGRASAGTGAEFFGIEAGTGKRMQPMFGASMMADVDAACALAEEAFDAYRETGLERRAAFLEMIAENILAIGDELIERCVAESGLARGRLEGERGRTVSQLRMFAGVVRDGGFLDARIDEAVPERHPAPKPGLRMRNVALGPVAVFGSSNFPLAFSVAGGDAASALAAGCPVVGKAHSAHPGTSELVGRAVRKAVESCALPEGVFSLLFDDGFDVGQALVADARISAVGFTGSRKGGMALARIAAQRREPIPVYAEMSSINPVILFPAALAARGAAIGKSFVGALTLGAGQFCTKPGLILAIESEGLEKFLAAAGEAISAMPAAVMLTSGIHAAYCNGVGRLAEHDLVTKLAEGLEAEGLRGRAALFGVSASDFLAHPELHDEVFGATSLVVRCRDSTEMRAVFEALEGQLTAAIHIDEADHGDARALLPSLERKVGRILVNGFGTGVEVGHAMVHGGPFPATSDGRSTSVGSLAIDRFLRPVCYQDLPAAMLPDSLKDENPLRLWRRVDGRMVAP